MSLRQRYQALEEGEGDIDSEWNKRFEEAIFDDLNTAKALAIVSELLDSNLANGDKKTTLHEWNSKIFDLDLDASIYFEPTAEQQDLLEKREQFRLVENFAEADKIRDQFLAENLVIEDTPEGAKLIRKPNP